MTGGPAYPPVMSDPQSQSAQGQQPHQLPVPPGWYPDPDMGPTQRYWDGHAWTGDPVPLDRPAGWYPDPHMAGTQRYWDGAKWGDNVAPMSARPPSAGPSQVLIGVMLAGAAIGFVMSMQSASLLTGTGTLWTGVAIIVGCGILAWATKAPGWVRVVVGLAAVVAIVNVASIESELADRRQEINNILD